MLLLLFLFSITESVSLFQSDSLEIQEKHNQSFWEKVSFGIGYEGGLCWTGEDLEKANAQPLDVSAKFYLINSFKGSVIYHLNENQDIEVGLGYGLANLSDRKVFNMNVPLIESGDSILETSGEWSLHFTKLYLNIVIENYSIGFTYNFNKSETKEYFYDGSYNLIESSHVIRWCRGLGINFSYNFHGEYFSPYISLGVGSLGEYKNDAPWKWEWDDKLSVCISGFYFGLIYKIGGFK